MKKDTEIQNDVKDELTWEPSIRAKEINVEVKKTGSNIRGDENN